MTPLHSTALSIALLLALHAFIGCVEQSTTCPAGYFCDPDDTENAEVECELGTDCPEGSQSQEDCEQGYYCVTPASGKKPCPKGNFCPAKSALPTLLTSGYYAVDASGIHVETGGIDQAVCPAGYYCRGGEKRECHFETSKKTCFT